MPFYDYGTVKPGRMRSRVTLQSLLPVSDQAVDIYGQPSQQSAEWQALGTFWAHVRALSGREVENAGQVKAEVTHRVTMRWPGAAITVLPDMRLEWGSITLNIVSVLNVDSRNRRLDLVAQQIEDPDPA